MNAQTSSSLQQAMELYRRTFGHGVPAQVAALYGSQPGPLLVEIRQAIALARPVPAWIKHSQRSLEPNESWARIV